MKFIILMMLAILCMSWPGSFIFAVMLLVVALIVDVRHHHVITYLMINRMINDLKIACENIEIKVVKK